MEQTVSAQASAPIVYTINVQVSALTVSIISAHTGAGRAHVKYGPQ